MCQLPSSRPPRVLLPPSALTPHPCLPTRRRLAESLRAKKELAAFCAAFVARQTSQQPLKTKEELWAKLQQAVSFMCESAGKDFAALPKNGYGQILIALVPEYTTLAVGPKGAPYKGAITQFV